MCSSPEGRQQVEFYKYLWFCFDAPSMCSYIAKSADLTLHYQWSHLSCRFRSTSTPALVQDSVVVHVWSLQTQIQANITDIGSAQLCSLYLDPEQMASDPFSQFVNKATAAGRQSESPSICTCMGGARNQQKGGCSYWVWCGCILSVILTAFTPVGDHRRLLNIVEEKTTSRVAMVTPFKLCKNQQTKVNIPNKLKLMYLCCTECVQFLYTYFPYVSLRMLR